MKLPEAHNAVVPEEKLRDYLLSPTHPIGRFKARLFRALGYSQDRWTDLAEDLRSHAVANEAELGAASEYGTKYEVRGAFAGRNGRSVQLCVVWMLMSGENVPRLVTAFPERDRR